MADDAKPTEDQAQPEAEQKEETAAPTEAAKTEEKAEAKPAEEKKEEPKTEQKPAEPKEAPKATAKADDKPSKQYSKEVADIVGKVETMTVLEVADLVSAIEDKFGVSAAPVAVAGAAPTAGGDTAGEDEGGKSEFTIHLVKAGEKKIEAIKAVREITQLGLKEAKDLVDGAPKDIKENVPADEAKEAQAKLEAAGCTVELK